MQPVELLGARFNSLAKLLAITADHPELVKAQVKSLSRQLPLLYLILALNTCLLGYSFVGRAPNVLTIMVPVGISVLCAARAARWWGLRHGKQLSTTAMVGLLRRCVLHSMVLGIGFSIWALRLTLYGDALAAAHVEFYMSITVIGCAFCLMHLPAAALMLTFCVMAPFCSLFLWEADKSLILIAGNAALVFSALFVVLTTYYEDFVRLIISRKSLEAKQTEAAALHKDNVRLANMDTLTGLPNRRLFFEDLGLRVLRASRENDGLAVALIDLDGFKPVNDVYGHAAGDQVLVQAAARLARQADKGRVSRLGGDEFAVIIDPMPGQVALMVWAESLCCDLSAPYVINGATVRLSGSVGLATTGREEVSADKLIERADYALYQSKRQGPGRASIFSGEHEQQIRRLNLIGQRLRGDDLDDELSIAFQPIVDTHMHATIGFEALARWSSPTVGEVPPDEFILVAERLGLISRLTYVLLRKTLAHVTTWPAKTRVSFNLSTRDLVSSEAIASILDLVRKSGVDASRIDFEITETSLMSDFAKANEGLVALEALGCGISLDDFGTGHSSLSYVHRLRLNKIKIDQSFVDDLETSAAAIGIVKTIVDMGRNLGIECIVEGVETEAQLLRLRQLGCRLMQGYLFGKPMQPGLVLPYLEQETRVSGGGQMMISSLQDLSARSN